jgi:AraC-like DNA-binding protein
MNVQDMKSGSRSSGLLSESSFNPKSLWEPIDDSPPFQPFINAKTQDYHEKQVDWIANGLKNSALFYQFRTSVNKDGRLVSVFPDACPNILFECDPDEPKAVISGVFLEPRELILKQDVEYFGFKPYSSLYVHSDAVSLTELIDVSIDFLEAFPSGEHLIQQIVRPANLDERIRLFNTFARSCMIDPDFDPGFVDYFSSILCKSRGIARLGDMSQWIGYSERYCRKRFKDAFGYSPKQYGSVMRFQNVLKTLAKSEHEDYSSVVFDNGFFDQAHFIHSFERYTHLTPGMFHKEIRTEPRRY